MMEAQKLYERAQLNKNAEVLDMSINIEEHNRNCFAGIARTSIKMGDMQRGFSLASEINDKNLIIEIAGVCEQMKQWTEAAKLYQKGGLVEKAASIYIQLKMFTEANPLIDKISSPAILVLFAKAKETTERLKESSRKLTIMRT
jgi:WD repeat-containing protein 19